MDKAYIRKKKQKRSLPSAVLSGVTAAIICGTLIIIIFTFLSLKFEDPISVAPIFGVSALMLSALAGGYVGARSICEKGFLTGAITGLIFILVIAIVSLFSRSVIKTPMFSILAPIAVIISSLGGAIGAGKRKTKRKHKDF